MADISYNVDAALAEVPINLLPLVDTDEAIVDDMVYNASGLDLVWNFVTVAGAMTQTAVTPTDTGGNYDFINQGNGLYSIEVPASGGASINNDTEGFGWFTGVATGIKVWRSPVYLFRASALNVSLVTGQTTGLLGPTTATRTLDVTATGAAGIDWANVENPTTALNLSATNIDTDQVIATAVNVTTVNGLAANVITAASTATDYIAEIAALLTATVADSVPADGTRPSIASGILMITRFLMEASVAATTVTVTKEDGSTSSMTFTIDDATNPTSITRAS